MHLFTRKNIHYLYNEISIDQNSGKFYMENLENFRSEVKAWLDENCPPSMRNGADPSIPLMMRFGVEEMLSIKILNLRFGLIEWVPRVGQCQLFQKNMVAVA